MKIYIASSWKNHHAVEMLSRLLEEKNHVIVSFVREGVKPNEVDEFGGFDAWVWSDNGEEKFLFDMSGAMMSDLVIYIGPSGTDAWAEVGAAWASKVPVYGITGKGEPSGLTRRMIQWCDDIDHLISSVEALSYAL